MVRQDDEANPLESEILREVAEEMKEEQLKQLWRKYGSVIAGIIIVVLLATGGYEFYRHYQKKTALEESARLQSALILIDEGQGSEGAEMLKELRDTSRLGYRYLAALYYADYQLAQGPDNMGKTIDALNFIIQDEDAPAPVRNVAMFDKIALEIDSGNADYAALEKELETLFSGDNAWTVLGLEMSANLALRQGDMAKAKARWQQILQTPNLPEAKSIQISEYLAFAGEAENGAAVKPAAPAAQK